jgi:hypothetical protein
MTLFNADRGIPFRSDNKSVFPAYNEADVVSYNGHYPLIFPVSDLSPALRKVLNGKVRVNAPGYFASHNMGYKEVQVWTKWASDNNVQFHGERGYFIGKTPNENKPSPLELGKLAFLGGKECGFVKTHKRTEEARMRRAAKRGAYLSLRGKIYPVVKTGYSLTHSQITKLWRSTSKVSIQALKLGIPKAKILYLPSKRLVISDALARLISAPSRSEVVMHEFNEPLLRPDKIRAPENLVIVPKFHKGPVGPRRRLVFQQLYGLPSTVNSNIPRLTDEDFNRLTDGEGEVNIPKREVANFSFDTW